MAAIILLSKGPQAKVFELQMILSELAGHGKKAQEVSLRDVPFTQVVGQHPAEVVQTGLAGTIGKGLERGNT